MFGILKQGRTIFGANGPRVGHLGPLGQLMRHNDRISGVDKKGKRDELTYLHTDGSVDENGLGCCAGVIRDVKGNYLQGFFMQLGTVGKSTSLEAEGMGAKIGLEYIYSLGYSYVHAYTDSQILWNLVTKEQLDKSISGIISDVLGTIGKLGPTFKLVRIVGKQNQAADALAEYGQTCKSAKVKELHPCANPPPKVVRKMENDKKYPPFNNGN